MPLSPSSEPFPTFYYRAPAWAQACFEPQLAEPVSDCDPRDGADDKSVSLFSFPDDRPSADEIWTGRISVAVVVLGGLWFGGQVIAAMLDRL
jgi:hypothetical protein